MKVLAVDTATSWQSVALLDGAAVVARQDQEAAGSHGALLLPAIERVLAEAGMTLAQLDGLACSIGPGSFTGLRVGAATLLGLRAATDLPLALVPTLEAMAWNLQGHESPLCPVLTSRKGELYWAVFQWRNGTTLDRILPEQVGAPQACAQSLTGATVLFGEGWTSMEAEIRAALRPAASVITVPSGLSKPSAVSVGLAGIERLRRGEIAGEEVAPVYVQRAEAEVKFEQSGGLSPVARRQARVAIKTTARAARQRPPARKSHG
ncbi:MAG TPA: tRNA (adenosine(37)-N6)-threonylcarbamoyltransferase complex dimerization subunit type 1 TsaB [Bryobacteraceae bacterium]|nr:tRNA (adenosine(37)-N6)-threonylcarbamoyltransferase complex dimerization subunit type 1 TsaB [Bryobacteraceae bacterium]